ncbi:MAG: DNA mismatch repair endonuclease MutL, partial [Chloroflexi bacterium]
MREAPGTKIRRLDASVVARIAAGEMITRPASALKEVIENAVDAGSRSIEIAIEEALDHRFSVSDDGEGIGGDDLPLALERHTTSKISAESDLLAVRSLGFRGEALASIAAVSRVEITSRRRDSNEAWKISAAGGEVGPIEAAARAPGTTVVVQDLFYNTPVRKRFLKPPRTELRLGRETVLAFATCFPSLSWRLRQDGKTILDLPAASDLKARLLAIHGRRLRDGLLEVSYQGGGIEVSGFVGVPDLAKPGMRHQMLFVNDRWVVSPWLSSAIRHGFGDLLPAQRNPWAVLFLRLPPEAVDVNVHPSKREVRFLDERTVFGVVRTAVQKAVVGLVPRFFSGASGAALQVAQSPQGQYVHPKAELNVDGTEIAETVYGSGLKQSVSQAGLVGDLFENEQEKPASRAAASVWQLHNRYVLAQTRKGL